MSEIRFRPFRYVDGKVIVTDYRAWNKMRIEAQKGNKIVVVADLSIVPEMQCVNYKGERLYFNKKTYEERESIFGMVGYDCSGVPALNHYYEPKYKTHPSFEPLMTSRVVREFNDMIDRFNLNIIKLLK